MPHEKELDKKYNKIIQGNNVRFEVGYKFD
jgi:hypothetical protein